MRTISLLLLIQLLLVTVFGADAYLEEFIGAEEANEEKAAAENVPHPTPESQNPANAVHDTTSTGAALTLFPGDDRSGGASGKTTKSAFDVTKVYTKNPTGAPTTHAESLPATTTHEAYPPTPTTTLRPKTSQDFEGYQPEKPPTTTKLHMTDKPEDHDADWGGGNAELTKPALPHEQAVSDGDGFTTYIHNPEVVRNSLLALLFVLGVGLMCVGMNYISEGDAYKESFLHADPIERLSIHYDMTE